MENNNEVRRKIFAAGLGKTWESHKPNEVWLEEEITRDKNTSVLCGGEGRQNKNRVDNSYVG